MRRTVYVSLYGVKRSLYADIKEVFLFEAERTSPFQEHDNGGAYEHKNNGKYFTGSINQSIASRLG